MIEEEQENSVIQGPGQLLKQARERANLSSQDIADRMKLKKAIVEDLERDNYDINISLTFIKGYLKLYAKHVQVSEAEVLSAFESLSTQNQEPAKLQSFSRRVAHQANDDKLMLVTYLIIAVVIALVVIWWFQQSPIDSSSPTKVNNNPESESSSFDASDNNPPAALLQKSSTPTNIEAPVLPVLQQEKVEENSVSATVATDIQSIEEQTIETPSLEDNVPETTVSMTSESDDLETTIEERAAPVELIFEFSFGIITKLPPLLENSIILFDKISGIVSISFNTISCCFKMLL